MTNTTTLIVIDCYSGCDCPYCSQEFDHTRGPYASADDAQKRIAYWLAGPQSFAPAASRCKPNGRYVIRFIEAETISRNRWVINNKILPARQPVKLTDNGALNLKPEPTADYEILTNPGDGFLGDE